MLIKTDKRKNHISKVFVLRCVRYLPWLRRPGCLRSDRWRRRSGQHRHDGSDSRVRQFRRWRNGINIISLYSFVFILLMEREREREREREKKKLLYYFISQLRGTLRCTQGVGESREHLIYLIKKKYFCNICNKEMLLNLFSIYDPLSRIYQKNFSKFSSWKIRPGISGDVEAKIRSVEIAVDDRVGTGNGLRTGSQTGSNIRFRSSPANLKYCYFVMIIW